MKSLFIQFNDSIKEALKRLNKSGKGSLVVVGEDDIFLGTLSDGDVRKAILKGEKIKSSIKDIYNNNSTFLIEGSYSNQKVKKIFLKNKFDLIPIVDKDNKVVDVLNWVETFENGKSDKNPRLDVPVVIMAGGKGTRLEPFTKILPKPLVPVKDKTIIETIIERFYDLGCSQFHLAVNYKASILKAYFEELNPEYNISFVEEEMPLGTAGSLFLLDGKFDQPFFVTNCDIIIKADYVKLYEFHKKGGFDITLVASAKEYVIPYGTCELNSDGQLEHINEKPKYDFLINTGLYILNPDVLSLIPQNIFYHITHLIEDAKGQGKKVGVFPIDEDSWIDVGEWSEYKRAAEKL
tara:strand:+ start:834 stop:1883 length:1050 start_codon:yes stop_codon:yes gene_type:complete